MASSAVAAQDTAVPDYAYDMLTDIGMANTATQKCDGLAASDEKIRAATIEMVMNLVGDGLDANAVVRQMSSDTGLAEINKREARLRAKHGVAASGDAALCQAIRAEMAENDALSAMLRGK